MAKKRTDGYYRSSFVFNEKRYYVYAKTKDELREKENNKRDELKKGIESRINPTFDEYYKKWAEARRGQVSEATLRSQQKIINIVTNTNLDNTRFGDLKLKEITIDELRFIQRSLQDKRKSQSVNDYMALVKHIMSDATKERVLDYNPCVLLKPLKLTESKARDTIHRALTIDEQKVFFENAKDSFYYNVYRLAVCTGMRVGEIGALKKTDIYDGLIHVERTITRDEIGAYYIGDNAKTEAGRRVIPINNQIKAILEDQQKQNEIMGNKSDLLFRSRENGLLLATPCDRAIKKICLKSGIEHFTMHSFRATFATRCIENGMDFKTLQELLGHTNFNLTMSLYGHALTDTKKRAMDNIIIEM